MSSSDRSDALDLEHDLPTTTQDVAALRRARRHVYWILPNTFASSSGLPPRVRDLSSALAAVPTAITPSSYRTDETRSEYRSGV